MYKTSTHPKQATGCLYVVSTPIGNLEDITLRALKILGSVDLIAAESIQHSKGLCMHYGIKTRLTSYNQNNQKSKQPKLIERLRSGHSIALITNAGTPGISDPGTSLIQQALGEKIVVSPIPGPSAVIAALSVSGLRSDRFLFLGFLSSMRGKRRKELAALASESRTLVFYEAPHRLKDMFKDLADIFDDREVVLLRELTKAYEEIKKGNARELSKDLEALDIKGECTLVVAGKGQKPGQSALDPRIQKKIELWLKEYKMSIRDIASRVSSEMGLNYRAVYKMCLSLKSGLEPYPQKTYGVDKKTQN